MDAEIETLGDALPKEQAVEPSKTAEEAAREIERDAFGPWTMNREQKQYMGAFDLQEAAAIIQRATVEPSGSLDELTRRLEQTYTIGADEGPVACTQPECMRAEAASEIEAYANRIAAQCVKEAREKLVNSILLNIGNLLPSERGNWDKLEGAIDAAVEATK